MIQVPLLGQRDPRWSKISLGSVVHYWQLRLSFDLSYRFVWKTNVGETNDLLRLMKPFPTIWFFGLMFQGFEKLKVVYRYYAYDNNKVADYVYQRKLLYV